MKSSVCSRLSALFSADANGPSKADVAKISTKSSAVSPSISLSFSPLLRLQLADAAATRLHVMPDWSDLLVPSSLLHAERGRERQSARERESERERRQGEIRLHY